LGAAAGVATNGTTVAHAESHYNISGFSGVDIFASNTELGNSWRADQVPNTSVLLGMRLGWVVWMRPTGAAQPTLELESEFKIAPAFTANGSAVTYFAPVFGWRGHALASVHVAPWLRVHGLVGAGGESIASTSPFMADETDPVAYWGLGVRLATSDGHDGWRLRLDGRHAVSAGRMSTLASSFEIQLGVETSLGTEPARRRRRPAPVIAHDEFCRRAVAAGRYDESCLAIVTELPVDRPAMPRDVDEDRDGLIGAADHCPDQAEDLDGLGDDDGCPETDADGDAIVDTTDKCPSATETLNHFNDDDGCPDLLPAALRELEPVRFARNKAKLSAAGSKQLVELTTALREAADVRITIVGFDAGGGKAAAGLRERRIATIKWFLIDHGVAAERIEVSTVEASAAEQDQIEIRTAP
jgi:outer membrane protein OmpA-like peptidoglycan-associated protein